MQDVADPNCSEKYWLSLVTLRSKTDFFFHGMSQMVYVLKRSTFHALFVANQFSLILNLLYLATYLKELNINDYLIPPKHVSTSFSLELLLLQYALRSYSPLIGKYCALNHHIFKF